MAVFQILNDFHRVYKNLMHKYIELVFVFLRTEQSYINFMYCTASNTREEMEETEETLKSARRAEHGAGLKQ
jgi:hypothetical protein